ncbi:hypothetical protein C8J57DRAFT_1485617 [Mycena rebaudengoi]|nr:hypothetical protein C8J57DRAFT_1485617 [Mycena rebaudengoi]
MSTERSCGLDFIPVHRIQLSAPSLSLLLHPFTPYSYSAHTLQIPLHRPLRCTCTSYYDGGAAPKSVVATGLYLLESRNTADLKGAHLGIMLTEAGASDPQEHDEQQGGPLHYIAGSHAATGTEVGATPYQSKQDIQSIEIRVWLEKASQDQFLRNSLETPMSQTIQSFTIR